MSDRIQPGDILTEAFQFGFYRWLTVFRFAWAPVAIAILIMFGIFYSIFDMEAAKALENNNTASWEDVSAIFKTSPAVTILALIAVGLVSSVLYCGFFASIYRLVALGEDRPGFFHLRFDGPAMRVFAALVIVNLLNLIIPFVIFFLLLALNGASLGDFFNAWPALFSMAETASGNPSYQPSQEELAMFAPIAYLVFAMLISMPLLAYINVKLAPFPPGTAAENRLILLGSLRMTKGHAWAIFGTYVLFFLAVIVMSILFSLATGFLDLMAQLGGSLAFVGAIFGAISFIAGLVYQIFMMGVQLSLQAIIYRRLKTGE